jgi:hypothetical protein
MRHYTHAEAFKPETFHRAARKCSALSSVVNCVGADESQLVFGFSTRH